MIYIHGNNNGGIFECNGKMVPEVIEVVFLHNSLVPQRVPFTQSYPVEGSDRSANWRRKDLPVNFFK